MARQKLKPFTIYYHRYVNVPKVNELVDLGCYQKTIKAKDFEDAWDRWWKQNPCGDIYRDAYGVMDEEGQIQQPR